MPCGAVDATRASFHDAARISEDVSDGICSAALAQPVEDASSEDQFGDLSRGFPTDKTPAPRSVSGRARKILGCRPEPLVGNENANDESLLHGEDEVCPGRLFRVKFPGVANCRVNAFALGHRPIHSDENRLVCEDGLLSRIAFDDLADVHQPELV